jgi:hypothetical protein
MQARVSYSANKKEYTVRIVLTTAERASGLERALIVKYKPRDNPNKLKLYDPTPVELDLLDEYEGAFTKTNKAMEEAPF